MPGVSAPVVHLGQKPSSSLAVFRSVLDECCVFSFFYAGASDHFSRKSSSGMLPPTI